MLQVYSFYGESFLQHLIGGACRTSQPKCGLPKDVAWTGILLFQHLSRRPITADLFDKRGHATADNQSARANNTRKRALEGTPTRTPTNSNFALADMSSIHNEQTSSPIFDIDIERWRRGDKARREFPHVAEPLEVACYSKDINGKIASGSRDLLRRFVEPQGQVDLNVGYESFIPKCHNEASIEKVLQVAKAQCEHVLKTSHIVTYRNNLNKIGHTLNNPREEWEIDCCQAGSQVYLDIRMLRPDSREEEQRRMMYQGYRFEAVCTGEADQVVNANSEFCSITSCVIADHSILLASEIDCTSGDPKCKENPVRDYVELKTMKAIEQDHQLRTMYRHRFPKYWLQSFFAGVPTIMLGLRSKEGLLNHVKRLDVHQLPCEAEEFFQARREQCWNPAMMLNFLEDVLTNIRAACEHERGRSIRVRYDSNSRHVTARFINYSEDNFFSRLSACLTD